MLQLIVERLEQFGIESFGLDLTRPRFGVPAARVITPGLQLEPSEIVTPRLADMMARTGGGAIYTGGVALDIDCPNRNPDWNLQMQDVAGAQRLAAGESATAPGSAARLSVSLVGRLAIRFNGRSVELRTQKAGAVLSYLALTEAKHESRERLVGLLWSRSDEEKARASLRQVVRELRSAFEDAGYGGFVAGRLSIHLDPEQVEVDVESIIRRRKAAACIRCCSIPRISTSGFSRAWTISILRSGSGFWRSVRPSMTG